ncbi:CobW family GTP-binding protein, partial [Brucella grignonensis]|uniref:CobW family GTP-binding protein n=1 Tax=Brucella grignonensis TaxID=94627 RepID=UPI001ABF58BC
GCACCSVANGLTETLLTLTEQADPPEAIILEASGIAEPQPILHIALTNPGLALNGVLSLVDAETVLSHAKNVDYGMIVERQVAGADLVILNKTDLVSPAQRDDVRSWMARRSPRAGIVETVEAAVPVEIVLGQHSSEWPEALSTVSPGGFKARAAPPFTSWSFRTERPLSAERLGRMMDELPGSILRAKGILHIA